jgi:hypothetical protein
MIDDVSRTRMPDQGSTPMIHAQTTIRVGLSRISLHADDIGMRLCPNCAHPMDLHQPDSGLPERMLWTCNHCATWYLMDINAVGSDAVLVCLPDHGHFRAAIAAP